MSRPALVTAHRAGARRGPENTLAALRLAIADGADMAEIDVQPTADGHIVAFHDADLRRICGMYQSIWEMPLADLRALDAGRWFAPEFQGEKIPTLAEMIGAARGKIRLNIEIKSNGHDPRLVERIIEIVGHERFAAECILTSFDPHAIQEIRRRDPSLKIGCILDENDPADLDHLDVDLLSLAKSRATSELIVEAKRRGLPVHVWTVNKPEDILEMLDRNVDNLITDDPRSAIEVMRRHETP